MISTFHPFSIAQLPQIEFGSGKFNIVADITAKFGNSVLLVTGNRSFLSMVHWPALEKQLKSRAIHYEIVNVNGEPSPQLVDQVVAQYQNQDFDVVLGIGGGSALDAAKAIAGLLKVKRSVMDYLEGVGPELEYRGPAVPLIAVPTTAGTGSEATKNAVLSQQGLDGFKKSFRDDQLVANVAIVDPDLLATCPPEIIAANGMDALTQLIESYVSIKANAFNDALGINGLRAARDGLLSLYKSKGADGEARERMAFASLISGINLAQTGLGSVHGMASPLGAFYPVPHGVVCGTLVAAATELNINVMLDRDPVNAALKRYARVSEVLNQRRYPTDKHAWESLIELLYKWTEELKLEKLSKYGLTEEGLDHVVDHSYGSSMKTNPVKLEKAELRKVLLQRL